MAYTFFSIRSQIDKVGRCEVAFNNFKNNIFCVVKALSGGKSCENSPT